MNQNAKTHRPADLDTRKIGQVPSIVRRAVDDFVIKHLSDEEENKQESFRRQAYTEVTLLLNKQSICNIVLEADTSDQHFDLVYKYLDYLIQSYEFELIIQHKAKHQEDFSRTKEKLDIVKEKLNNAEEKIKERMPSDSTNIQTLQQATIDQLFDALISHIQTEESFETSTQQLLSADQKWKERLIPIIEPIVANHIRANEPVGFNPELQEEAEKRKELVSRKRAFAESIMNILDRLGLAIGYQVDEELLPHRLIVSVDNRNIKGQYRIHLDGSKNPTKSAVRLAKADFFPFRLMISKGSSSVPDLHGPNRHANKS